MKNEPVAWINEYDEIEPFNPENRQDWIPLYTHPAKTLKQIKGINYWVDAEPKTLTDEEIITVLSDKFVKGHGRYSNTNLFYLEFARAILRKAQEV